MSAPAPSAASRLAVGKAPVWKRWGLFALAFYALKGVVWLVLGWTVLRH